MRSFLTVFALAGLLGLAAGCGPEEEFCPNSGADAGGVCPILGDDGSVKVPDAGGGGGLGCGPNQQATIVDGGVVCVDV